MEREYQIGHRDRTVTLELWWSNDVAHTVRLVAARWVGELRQHVATLFIDRCKEAERIAQSALKDECPAKILADWIQDHPEVWRTGEGARPAAELICDWLRWATLSVLIS